jgi:hypothetical protein
MENALRLQTALYLSYVHLSNANKMLDCTLTKRLLSKQEAKNL